MKSNSKKPSQKYYFRLLTYHRNDTCDKTRKETKMAFASSSYEARKKILNEVHSVSRLVRRIW